MSSIRKIKLRRKNIAERIRDEDFRRFALSVWKAGKSSARFGVVNSISFSRSIKYVPE